VTALLEAKDLHFAYPKGSPAVSGVSFRLAPRELVAVIGPNGSGKSTLLKLLAGILTPGRGEVLLEGRPLGAYERSSLARRISYVSQHATVALPFTVSEVVLMGRHPYQRGLQFEKKEDFEAVRAALELTGALPLSRRLFQSLSGGERQRVLIARAIAQDADVLLLDEPTAALDLKHEVKAWEILEKLVGEKKKSVVSVTHQINLASLFSPLLTILKEGRVVAEGRTSDLLEATLLASVYDTPVRVVAGEGSERYVLPRRAEAGD